MSDRHWYPHYVGDYMRDTQHLSLSEHGAYRVLLDAYYSSGPLPGALEACQRICRAFSDEEKQAVKSVLRQFFAINGDGHYHNRRADEEITRMDNQHTRLSEAGKRGMASRYSKATNQATNQAIAYPQSQSQSVPQSQPEKEKDTPPPPKGGGVYVPDFLKFWKAYPRKVGKLAAWRTWEKLGKKRPPLDTLLAAVEKQRASEQWTKDNGQFIPNPATWLNQGRWDDETKPKEEFAWIS